MSDTPKRKVRKDLKLKTVILIAILIMVAIFGAVFAFLNFHHSLVLSDNIYVNSLHIGGLNAKEAEDKINHTFNDRYYNKTVAVNYMDKTYNAELLGIVKVDAKKTAEDAFSKSDNLLNSLLNKEKIVVTPSITLDRDALKTDIIHFFLELENKDSVFTFDDEYTMAKVDASKLSRLMSVEKTIDALEQNIKNDIFTELKPVILKKEDKDFAEELYTRLARPKNDASVGINEDKSTYIIPEVVGIEASKEEFLKLYKENNGVFEIKIKPAYPDVRTKDLDIEFYQDVLGSYTSAYNVGLVNRTKNLSLAARLVNETVIMPGKRFSYNSVVGPRTYQRGFLDATVYTGEGTEEGIGGGICQVSSTIYCAQLRANLKTISRTNHSYTVVYVPLGQDATVVYGSLDYIFENDTNYPVKIQAYANGGYLTVKILGTKIDKSLTYDIVSVTNSTIAKKEVQKETEELPSGTTEVKQNGQNGAVVSTYKIYLKDGVEQKREYIGKSTYIPMNKIILVGTGKTEEEEETPNPETPENSENSENPEDKPVITDPGDVDITVPGNNEKPDTTDTPTSDTGL